MQHSLKGYQFEQRSMNVNFSSEFSTLGCRSNSISQDVESISASCWSAHADKSELLHVIRQPHLLKNLIIEKICITMYLKLLAPARSQS